jgi:pimeloyl-ACP methyl ester carboxylesterase
MNHRQFAIDIAMLCDQLGIGGAAFFGESTGAMLQLSLAVSRPDLMAAAVLAAASYFWSEEHRASLRTQTVDELAATWVSFIAGA